MFFRSQPASIPEAGPSQCNQGPSKAPAKQQREKRFLMVPQDESSCAEPLSSVSETIIQASDDLGKVSLS